MKVLLYINLFSLISFIIAQRCTTEGCSQCDYSNECYSCKPGYYFYAKNSTCILNDCPDVQYFKDSTGRCKKCENYDSYCITDNRSCVCTKCYPNMMLLEKLNKTNNNYSISTQCVACGEVKLGCIACDSSGCSKCTQEYYLNNNGACSSCKDPYCRNCDSKGECLDCLEGLFLNKLTNTCDFCFENCSICDNALSCISCEKGFYYDAGLCSPCPTGCSDCDRKYKCYSCDVGYTINNGVCVAKNGNTVGQSQNSPKPNTQANSKQVCPDNCESCNLDTQKCFGCSPRFQLDYFTNSCIQEDSNCKINGCITCTKDSKCLECYEPVYTLNTNNICLPQCDYTNFCNNCGPDNICKSCSDGRLDSGLCLLDNFKCNLDHCEQCAFGYCTACQDGYSLVNFICVDLNNNYNQENPNVVVTVNIIQPEKDIEKGDLGRKIIVPMVISFVICILAILLYIIIKRKIMVFKHRQQEQQELNGVVSNRIIITQMPHNNANHSNRSIHMQNNASHIIEIPENFNTYGTNQIRPIYIQIRPSSGTHINNYVSDNIEKGSEQLFNDCVFCGSVVCKFKMDCECYLCRAHCTIGRMNIINNEPFYCPNHKCEIKEIYLVEKNQNKLNQIQVCPIDLENVGSIGFKCGCPARVCEECYKAWAEKSMKCPFCRGNI